jgi:hypothetical protein
MTKVAVIFLVLCGVGHLWNYLGVHVGLFVFFAACAIGITIYREDL